MENRKFSRIGLNMASDLIVNEQPTLFFQPDCVSSAIRIGMPIKPPYLFTGDSFAHDSLIHTPVQRGSLSRK